MEANSSKRFTEQKEFKDDYSFGVSDHSSKALIREEEYKLTLSQEGTATLFYKFRKFIETESAADCEWEETLFKGEYTILAQNAQENIISLTFTSKDYKSIVEYTDYVLEEYKDKPCKPVFVYAYENKENNKLTFSENFRFNYLENTNKPGTLEFHEQLETLRNLRPDTEEAYFNLLTGLHSKGARALEDFIVSEFTDLNLVESLKDFENFVNDNFTKTLRLAIKDKARLLLLLAQNRGNIHAVAALYNEAYKTFREYLHEKGFADEAKIGVIFRQFDFFQFKHHEAELVNLGVDRLALYDFAGGENPKQDWISISEHFLMPLLSEKERKLSRLFQVPINAQNFVYNKENGIYKSYLHLHHPKLVRMSANYGVENFTFFYLDEDVNELKKPEKFQNFIANLRKEFQQNGFNFTERELVRITAELPKGKKAGALGYLQGNRKEILAKAEEILKEFPLFDEVYVARLLNQFDGDVDAAKKALSQ